MIERHPTEPDRFTCHDHPRLCMSEGDAVYHLADEHPDVYRVAVNARVTPLRNRAERRAARRRHRGK